MTLLLPPRIARRIRALAAAGSGRLARDYAAAYGADLADLVSRAAPQTEASASAEPRGDASPRAASPPAPPRVAAPASAEGEEIRIALDPAAPAPLSRRAQILRRLARREPGARAERTTEGFRILAAPTRRSALREVLAANAEVIASRLAPPDARVG